MRVSHFLGAAALAGVLILGGNAIAEEAAAQAGPSVENGEALFTERCSICHTGAVAPAPSTVGKLTREEFGTKVEGHAKVGAFEGLTEENLNDIHAYQQTQAEG